MSGRKWCKAEIEILKRYYPDIGKIAELTGRKERAIKVKAKKMDLNLSRNKKWSEEEIEILKRYYPDIKKIAELTGRCERAIRNKANKLRLNILTCSLCFACKNTLKCVWILFRKRIWRNASVSYDKYNDQIIPIYKVLECDFYRAER